MILHWNGTGWSVARSPDPSRTDSILTGVAASPGRGAWAVGAFCAARCKRPGNLAEVDHPLILRWNGVRWAAVASPHPGGGSQLSGIGLASPGHPWAVGYACKASCFANTPVHPLFLHWNGSRWLAR